MPGMATHDGVFMVKIKSTIATKKDKEADTKGRNTECHSLKETGKIKGKPLFEGKRGLQNTPWKKRVWETVGGPNCMFHKNGAEKNFPCDTRDLRKRGDGGGGNIVSSLRGPNFSLSHFGGSNLIIGSSANILRVEKRVMGKNIGKTSRKKRAPRPRTYLHGRSNPST